MPEASVNFGTGVSNAWSNVATFVPKFIVFLLILIIGYLIAKAIAKILTKVLQRVGFDRLVERGGIRTMSQRWEAVAARYDEEKPKVAAATRNAPAVAGQARQYADDRNLSSGSGATAYRQRPDDPGRY